MIKSASGGQLLMIDLLVGNCPVFVIMHSTGAKQVKTVRVLRMDDAVQSLSHASS